MAPEPGLFALFSSPFAMYDIQASVSRDLHRGHKVYLGMRKMWIGGDEGENHAEAAQKCIEIC